MALKSGKIPTVDSMVPKTVTWPHELVYTAKGKPAEYDNLSVSPFVSRYMAVMDTEKPTLRSVWA